MSEPVWVPLGASGAGGTGLRRYPVQLSTPRSQSFGGNSFWTVGAMTDFDHGRWEFVKDVLGLLYGQVIVPPTIDATKAAKIILAIAANATSGVTRLMVQTHAFADGASFNPVGLTNTSYADFTVPATANTRKDISVTLAATPAANDLLTVGIVHDGTHANDTLAVNTLLLGAWLEVTA